MSALTDGTLGLTFIKMTAEEATESRLHVSQLLGRRLPVSIYERGLYEAEGKVPPEE
ncbi:hypothetical protein [Tsukamurella soli]|uniref:Uncharacterized protein n=1 Tax=Tsukamurella soli TaxID=644556 RepID=A0ABP8JA28_9ACTN